MKELLALPVKVLVYSQHDLNSDRSPTCLGFESETTY